jgi:hypothetical protein
MSTTTIPKPPTEPQGTPESPQETRGRAIPLPDPPEAADGTGDGGNGPIDREPPDPDHGGRRDERPPRPPRWRRILIAALFGLLMFGIVVLLELAREPAPGTEP